MKVTRRKKILLAIAAVVVAFSAWRMMSAGKISREARENFEWFSTLGFPDVKDRPFVRVTNVVDEPWSPANALHSRYRRGGLRDGFLLSSNSSTFCVLNADMETRTYTNSPPGTPEGKRVGYQILDLQTEALRRLEIATNRNFRRDGSDPDLEAFTETDVLFAFAWSCWRQGMNSLAFQFHEEARRTASGYFSRQKRLPMVKAAKRWIKENYYAARRYFSRDGEKDTRTLRQQMEGDFAWQLWHWMMDDFGNGSLDRTMLVEKFEWHARRFPNFGWRTNMTEIIPKLKVMIAEDRSHQKISQEELEKLPQEEKIRELVFQLRNQAYSPYSYMSQSEYPEVKNSPAGQLIQLGSAGVPRLIAALDSEALTRCAIMDRHHGFRGSGGLPIMTVGQMAESLLEDMSGRYFPEDDGGAPADDRKKTIRANAEKWWAEYQKKGERQLLIDDASAGNWATAHLLRDKYPADLIPALVSGISAEKDSWTRTRLIEMLAESKDDAAVAILRDGLRNWQNIECRIAAVTGLRDHGAGAEAVAVMLKDWDTLVQNGGACNRSTDAQAVARFLVESYSVEALSALGRDMPKLPVEFRVDLVYAVGETNRSSADETNKPSPSMEIAVEQFLVNALEDLEENFDSDIRDEDRVLNDPRVSDVAAHLLAQRWSGRYKFDITGSFRVRERQRVECLNSWRRTHQIAELPIPQVPGIKVASADACKVTLIEWATNSIKPSKAIEAQVAKLNGRPLKAGELTGVFLSFARHPEAEADGLDIVAEKDADLTGVRLIAKLITVPGASRGDRFARSESIVLGGKEQDTGSAWSSTHADPEDWWDLEEAIAKAVATQPGTPFRIRIRLAVEPGTMVPTPNIR